MTNLWQIKPNTKYRYLANQRLLLLFLQAKFWVHYNMTGVGIWGHSDAFKLNDLFDIDNR